MNRRMYDAAMLLGLGLMTGGAWLQWGPAWALMSCGALVIVLTLLGVLVTDSAR